ncbi:hypothetical protein FCH28_21030 [Streptomyces piniterrae]|uniref:Integral membrane protein n=1 Tax=Streptomyces piniterrae TaxID=2571125 RepID=A0A4U0NAR5_9ACTN|nr:hypothetical protein [Streptomyces piniterrae]TJZ50989.1 hypothetical protein FCH28_21030 [Streptomyces piniterrae]
MQGTGVHPGTRPGVSPGAQLRAVRAALFTALCVTLSTASHVLLSGAPLPPVTVAAICAAVFAAAYALTGRRRGYGRFAALLVPLELAADTVFTAGQHTCYGPAGGPVTGPLRSVGVDLLCRGGEFGTPLARMAAHPGGAIPPVVPTAAPWLLLAAHVAVGLLAAAWLHRGDAALDGLLRAAAAYAFRPLLIAVTVAGYVPALLRRGIRASHPAPPARPLPLLAHCVLRRGPPRTAV